MTDPIILYKYIGLIGAELKGFIKKRETLYNFSCPYCGDSKKTSKKRGYFICKNQNWMFYCHNCSESKPIEKFIEEIDPLLYREYKQEVLTSYVSKKKTEADIFKKEYKFIRFPKVELAQKISSLPCSHQARKYLKSRCVPDSSLEHVKWTTNFQKLVSSTIGDKYKDTKLPDQGIVFELFDEKNNLTGYQIRSIENVAKKNRFVICSANDEHGIFKFKSIDITQPTFIVEGCIDSLFLKNSVAVLSASLYKLNIPTGVYINDCEPRNKEVCKQIEKCIEKGLTVCLLPPEKYNGMDINDIVKQYKYSEKELVDMINANCYKGLVAKLKFSQWRK